MQLFINLLVFILEPNMFVPGASPACNVRRGTWRLWGAPYALRGTKHIIVHFGTSTGPTQGSTGCLREGGHGPRVLPMATRLDRPFLTVFPFYTHMNLYYAFSALLQIIKLQ